MEWDFSHSFLYERVEKMFIQLCRLTKDTELKQVNINGEEKNVLNNTIAFQADKNNSVFVDVTAWGKNAELMAKYFKKGDEILIKGELRNKKNKINDKEFMSVYILVNTFEFTHGNKKETPKTDIEDLQFN